ncbi:MAG: hypothetical protein GY799_16070, partial [Desulfobulbaceae bacterium]|nr:hypothetical protein [Desulfobulbaceae bacterium]
MSNNCGCGGNRETELVTVTSILDSDFVRVINEDSSRKITLTNFTANQEQLLLDLGFITSSEVTQTRQVLEVSSAYTLKTSDEIITVDASAADVTISLFVAALVYNPTTFQTKQYQIKRIDDDPLSTKVTIIATGPDALDGDTTIEMIGGRKPFVNL